MIPMRNALKIKHNNLDLSIMHYNKYTMETSKHHSFKEFLPSFLILTLFGWIGLILVIILLLPTLGPRWLFYFFLILAISGSIMPVVHYLNKRFPSNPLAEKTVIIRQSIWFGAFAATITWLQMGRVLNTALGLILAGAFILIELLLRLWERSHWKTEAPDT